MFFRTAGPWGAGEGQNLTNVEVDTNFYELDQRVLLMETSPPEAVSIESFEVIGDLLYIHLTNYAVEGPFELPMRRFMPRGVWQPSTLYLVDDLVSMGGVLYAVPTEHTSALTFDPGANNGSGGDFYSVLFEAPETAIPTGGITRQVLGKLSNTNFDIGWITGLLPAGGSTTWILQKASAGNYDVEWAPRPSVGGLTTTDMTFSFGNRTLRATTIAFPNGDEFKYFHCNNTTGSNIRISLSVSEPFSVDTEISFRQQNTGSTITFTFDSGVTLQYPDGFLPRLYGRGAVATLKKVDTDTWDLFGLLAPA
jgi:hypothetical protein